MDELLARVLDAHGGLERWSRLEALTADIADTEDPGPARFEQQWHMLNALELSRWNVGSSEHEAVFVDGKLTLEPFGARRRADKDEQSAHWEARRRAIGIVPQDETLEGAVSEQRFHLGPVHDM